MANIGLRHVALNVRNAQSAKKFYCDLFGMTVEWEPDPNSVYLTTQSQDNLALHQAKNPDDLNHVGALNHIGFILTSEQDVDEMHQKAVAQDVVIVAEPRKHRDGAYSCYLKDCDGNVVQLLCHPPIVQREQK